MASWRDLKAVTTERTWPGVVWFEKEKDEEEPGLPRPEIVQIR
jgi:hypothetical protein